MKLTYFKVYLIFLAFLFQVQLYSQSEAIKQTLEDLSENQDVTLDYSELIENLEELEKQPVNLNSNKTTQLYQLFLIDEFQLDNLNTYIQENDALLSVNELLLIDGFTKEKIEALLPFIEVKPVEKTRWPNIASMAKYGHHDIFIRYQRILQKSNGFADFVASDNTNSYYLGNPDKYYFKYKYNFSNQIQWGFLTEKDAGELFLSAPQNEELRTALATNFHPGFDFSSFHLFGQDLGMIKQIAIGDYHLLFGQGLTLWTGLSFGKSADAVQLKRYESFIKPNTSSNENGFLRGAAIHLGERRWSTVLFYSNNKQDATIQTNDSNAANISTLLYTGLHRTFSEINKKDAVNIQVFGARFKYIWNAFSLGLTAYHTHLSKEIISSATPENLFDLQGNVLTNYGMDYAFKIGKANFYGEAALSSTGGKALISGMSLALNSRFKLSLLYRNYAKNYHSLFASALAENSSVNNEIGFFTGTQILLNKKLSLQAYVDFFRFPWLKYEQDSPSQGVEYRAQLFYDFKPLVKMHFKLKYKQKEVNTRSESAGEPNFLQNETRIAWQYQINYRINERFELRNRIEITHFEQEQSGSSEGYMIFQDVNYQSMNQLFGFSTRLAVFNTDDFSSAIYAYENDVLYAFSIPAYYGQGLRFYQVLKYALSKKIKFWLRYSLSYYPNKQTIGSGLDEIEGSLKSEVKMQVRLKI